MKITQILAPLLLATAAFSIPAHAQLFGTSTSATQDSDVYTGAGGTALAWDFSDYNSSTTTVVNGVTFSGDLDNATTGVDFIFELPNAGHDQNGVDDTALAASGGSSNYAYVLQHLDYTTTTPDSLTFTGLQAGESYELQIFAGGGASGPETFTDVSTSLSGPSGTLYYGASYNPAVAAFIDESFTAPVGGTETLDIASPGYIIVSAVNLQVVPEPSTYAMLFGGLGCLIFLARRKSLRLS
jgi:hypothetical protein